MLRMLRDALSELIDQSDKRDQQNQAIVDNQAALAAQIKELIMDTSALKQVVADLVGSQTGMADAYANEISALQAKNSTLSAQLAAGVDTTAAQADIDTSVTALQNLSAQMKAAAAAAAAATAGFVTPTSVTVDSSTTTPPATATTSPPVDTTQQTGA